MAAKRVLLTGGTGFVGACLARRLIQDGHEVHLLLRHKTPAWRLTEIEGHFSPHFTPLADADALGALLKTMKPDWVFHLSAHGAYSYQTDLAEILQTNIHATVNLVTAALAAGVEVFVNTGSSSEYGFKDHAPHEEEWIDPNSHYSLTKAFGTHFCRYAARKENRPIPTLRLYNIYGPYEEPTRLIPTLLLHGLKGALPPLVNPDISRDFTHVEDVCEAYLAVAQTPLEDPGAVFNVATGVRTTLREAVEVTRNLLSISQEPEWGSMEDRHWDTTMWVGNAEKARKILKWTPNISFEKGMASTLDWLKESPLKTVYEKAVFGD